MTRPSSSSSSDQQQQQPQAQITEEQKQELTKQLFAVLRSKESDQSATNKASDLIKQGADVNAIDEDGDEKSTPLHLACQNGRLEVAEFLFEKGADVNQADNYGQTPLHSACENGHSEVVELLLEKEAQVNQVANNGDTPLHYACHNLHKELAEFLIKKGADVNQANNNGFTPLRSVFSEAESENEILEVAKLLLSNGADVNQADNYGETPLYHVCFNHLELTRYLLLSGAKVPIISSHPLISSDDYDQRKRDYKTNILSSLKSITPAEISAIEDEAKQNPENLEKLNKIKENGVYLAVKILYQATVEEREERIGATEIEVDDLLIKAISYEREANAQQRRSKIITSRISSELVDSANFSSEQKMKIIDAMINVPEEFRPLVTTLNLTKVEETENAIGTKNELKLKTFEGVFNRPDNNNATTNTNDQGAKNVSTADIAPVILYNLVTKEVGLKPEQKAELLSIFTHPITKRQMTITKKDEVMPDAPATSSAPSASTSKTDVEMTDSHEATSAQQTNSKKRPNDSGVSAEEKDQKRAKTRDGNGDDKQTNQTPAQTLTQTLTQTQASQVATSAREQANNSGQNQGGGAGGMRR